MHYYNFQIKKCICSHSNYKRNRVLRNNAIKKYNTTINFCSRVIGILFILASMLGNMVPLILFNL